MSPSSRLLAFDGLLEEIVDFWISNDPEATQLMRFAEEISHLTDEEFNRKYEDV